MNRINLRLKSFYGLNLKNKINLVVQTRTCAFLLLFFTYAQVLNKGENPIRTLPNLNETITKRSSQRFLTIPQLKSFESCFLVCCCTFYLSIESLEKRKERWSLTKSLVSKFKQVGVALWWRGCNWLGVLFLRKCQHFKGYEIV